MANEIRAKVTTQAVLITQRRVDDGAGGDPPSYRPSLAFVRSRCARPTQHGRHRVTGLPRPPAPLACVRERRVRDAGSRATRCVGRPPHFETSVVVRHRCVAKRPVNHRRRSLSAPFFRWHIQILSFSGPERALFVAEKEVPNCKLRPNMTPLLYLALRSPSARPPLAPGLLVLN